MTEQNQDRNLEYIVLVGTEHHGIIGIILEDNGQKLGLVKVIEGDNKKFYDIMGVKQPKVLNLPSDTAIRVADPNFQLYLDGEYKELSQVAEMYYSKMVDVADMPKHKEPFMYRFWPFHILGLGFAAPLTYGFSTFVGKSISDIERVPFYVGTAILFLASIHFAKSSRNYQDKQRNNIANYENFFKELDQLRESLLRAGTLSGMFPQNYGLC